MAQRLKVFFTAISKGPLSAAGFLALHPSVATALVKLGIDGAIRNPLTTTYWQQVPSRFGARAAKFRLLPCDSNSNANEGNSDTGLSDFLTGALEDAFNTTSYTGDICFDFSVQFFESDQTTPIEDATVQWNTPWNSVATLSFLPNEPFVWGYGQDAFCRHLNFNPWNGITEHQPLGVLQRIRHYVYEQDGLRRWSLRGESSDPPTVNDWENYDNL